MKRKISALLILWSLCITTFAENTQTGKDYILLLNSANFNEAWTGNLYREISMGFSSDNIDVRTEELSVPMIRTLEEAELRRENLLRSTRNLPKLWCVLGIPVGYYVARYLIKSGRMFLP